MRTGPRSGWKSPKCGPVVTDTVVANDALASPAEKRVSAHLGRWGGAGALATGAGAGKGGHREAEAEAEGGEVGVRAEDESMSQVDCPEPGVLSVLAGEVGEAAVTVFVNDVRGWLKG